MVDDNLVKLLAAFTSDGTPFLQPLALSWSGVSPS
jgi:hypothetical protein